MISHIEKCYSKYDMTHPLWDLEMNYKPFLDGSTEAVDPPAPVHK